MPGSRALNRQPGFSASPSGKRILQFFSRYRNYGGEEGSVFRIGDLLQEHHDLGTFITSSDAFFGSPLLKSVAVAKAFRNWEVASRLGTYQHLGHYDLWLVHNVFPAMSPVVYELAFRWGIPVIQYLHNYRLGCVNGFFLNHGAPCQRCVNGNFFPALKTACWHESHLQSGVMGMITARARATGMFGKVHRWIAISHTQKEEHVRMGIPAERISVLPHFYKPKSPPMPYPGNGDVLFVGRLSPEKGVDRLLKAWKIIQDCGRHLVIVGDGPSRPGLESMAATLGLRNVVFRGFLQGGEMGEVWSRTACSVVPSIWKEPFGMVVLEAWAQGRPVVAHRIGALPEIIKEGDDGFLADPADPADLARAITRILDDEGSAGAMGDAGHRRLLEEFSADLWLAKMNGILDSVSSSPLSTSDPSRLHPV